jgi:hypothetical protein
MTAFLVWGKDDEGRVFAYATSMPREMAQDVLRDHGLAALRRFHARIWERLEADLFTKGQWIKTDADAIDVQQMEWTHEAFLAIVEAA